MDVRRELAHIRKNYRAYHRAVGETITWFEYQPFAASASAGSTYDDVYDEGGSGVSGRKYKTGVVVPVLMITEAEDTKRAIPEGRQPVQIVNLVASVEDFVLQVSRTPLNTGTTLMTCSFMTDVTCP